MLGVWAPPWASAVFFSWVWCPPNEGEAHRSALSSRAEVSAMLCGPQVHLQRRGRLSHHLSSCCRAASCIKVSAAFQPSLAFSFIMALGSLGSLNSIDTFTILRPFSLWRKSISQTQAPPELCASLRTKTPSRWMEKGSIVGEKGTDRQWVHLCLWGSFPLGSAPGEQPSWVLSLAVAPLDTLFPSVATSRAIFSTGPMS